MRDLDATLTDFALFLECSLFVVILFKSKGETHILRRIWILFFGAVAAASLCGGVVHGFLEEGDIILYKILWSSTLVFVGIAAFSAWLINAYLIDGINNFRKWLTWDLGLLTIYLYFVLFVSQSYSIVIINYVPPMLVLLAVSGLKYFKSRQKHFLYYLVGMLLTFIAAIFQQLKIGLHPEYFDHNGLYHLIQGFGLYGLFRGVRLHESHISG